MGFVDLVDRVHIGNIPSLLDRLHWNDECTAAGVLAVQMWRLT